MGDAQGAIPNSSRYIFPLHPPLAASVLFQSPSVLMSASAMARELSSKPEDDHGQEHTLRAATDVSKWPSRSRSQDARVLVKNRRKRYLDTHPEYFSSPSLELAGLPYTRM